MSGGPALVIGIGNPDRSDDACGRWVARRLAGRVPARVVESEGETSDLLELWSGAEQVIIVDAVRSGARPGTIHRLTMDSPSLGGATTATSTHGLGLDGAIGIARALGRAPGRLVVFGIEAASVAPGRRLDPAVEHAIGEVAERIRAELVAPQGEPIGGRAHA